MLTLQVFKGFRLFHQKKIYFDLIFLIYKYCSHVLHVQQDNLRSALNKRTIKGTVSPDQICPRKWYGQQTQVSTCDAGLNFFFPCPYFVLNIEDLMQHTQNTHQLTFLKKLVSFTISQLRIFTHLLPIVQGVALDVLGNQEVQLQYFFIPTMADFSSFLKNAVSIALVVFLFIQSYTLHHRNLGRATD